MIWVHIDIYILVSNYLVTCEYHHAPSFSLIFQGASVRDQTSDLRFTNVGHSFTQSGRYLLFHLQRRRSSHKVTFSQYGACQTCCPLIKCHVSLFLAKFLKIFSLRLHHDHYELAGSWHGNHSLQMLLSKNLKIQVVHYFTILLFSNTYAWTFKSKLFIFHCNFLFSKSMFENL